MRPAVIGLTEIMLHLYEMPAGGGIHSFSTELRISARCQFYVHQRTCLKKKFNLRWRKALPCRNKRRAMTQCGLPSVIRNFSGAITALAEGEAIISVTGINGK
jgi:hypothetical protein